MNYETQRAALLIRIETLKAEIEANDPEQHTASLKAEMHDLAANGADDERLAEMATAIRLAALGADEVGSRHQIANARLHAVNAELRELEAAEQVRQREQLAAEVIEAGECLKVAAEEAAQAFKGAVRAHMRATAVLARRERAKAALAGRHFDGIGKPDLYRFQPLNDLFGQVLPASAFALGRDDKEFRQIAAEAEREANQLMTKEAA